MLTTALTERNRHRLPTSKNLGTRSDAALIDKTTYSPTHYPSSSPQTCSPRRWSYAPKNLYDFPIDSSSALVHSAPTEPIAWTQSPPDKRWACQFVQQLCNSPRCPLLQNQGTALCAPNASNQTRPTEWQNGATTEMTSSTISKTLSRHLIKT